MPAAAKKVKTVAKKSPPLAFDKRLVLNQFLLGLFGVASFGDLAAILKDPRYEGWDEEGVSRFHGALVAACYNLERLPTPGPTRDRLREYDGNIFRHTAAINAPRAVPVGWKYFQYLALLFAELYLDLYFRPGSDLLAALNRHVAAFNDAHDPADHVAPYMPDDLRTLAFWMATGSGKTLLMHVNILQYRHYLALASSAAGGLAGQAAGFNRTILLTPNEGLSRQHLEELAASGIPAELFDKNGGALFRGQAVEIIDIHKLAEDMGEKTVAVDAFEGNNLVLIDEGHRGASGFADRDKRDRLAAGGFSFEYSATFGQAVKAAKKDELVQEYAHAILFDYSYKFFYRDGYGKDYQILNLNNETDETRHLYLVASLLAFYQQQRAFREGGAALVPYRLTPPLWIFVGNSVNLGTRERSDVIELLRFLAAFVADRAASVAQIDRLLGGAPGFTATGTDPFAGKFTYLLGRHEPAAALFADILATLFNAPGGGRLRVEELKGAEGELALRLGTNTPFGVINVGDARTFAKICDAESAFDTASDDFSPSLFRDLNAPSSRVNLLVGARKFTEGWSSWRVSSMGLLNVGKGEGAQIIQLFGRGVRLQGRGGSLQRSAALPPPDGHPHPATLPLLETLNIFGIHADYMTNFKEYLAAEGLPADTTRRDFTLPTVKRLPARPLMVPALRPGTSFDAHGPSCPLAPVPGLAVDLKYFPKLESLESVSGPGLTAIVEKTVLEPRHLAFLDYDAILFALLRHKRERGWHNLVITRDAIVALLARPDWYTLTIPAAELAFDAPAPLRRARAWQEIATILLKKYCESFYKRCRATYEAPHRHYATVTADDPNFIPAYEFKVSADTAHDPLWATLERVKVALAADTLTEERYGPLLVFSDPLHLYQPLVHIHNGDLAASPTYALLNTGELDFIHDLRAFLAANTARFADTELHLLRNVPKIGVGFAEAGNFYPDFILWLLTAERQQIVFLDPKGILHLKGLADPKIQLHRTIKEIEAQLADPAITLDSFIIANTDHAEVAEVADLATFRANHVLFQHDEKPTYIRAIFDALRAGSLV